MHIIGVRISREFAASFACIGRDAQGSRSARERQVINARSMNCEKNHVALRWKITRKKAPHLMGLYGEAELLPLGLKVGLYQGQGVLTGVEALVEVELLPVLGLGESSGDSSGGGRSSSRLPMVTPRRVAKPVGSTLATLTSHGSTMESSTFCVDSKIMVVSVSATERARERERDGE